MRGAIVLRYFMRRGLSAILDMERRGERGACCGPRLAHYEEFSCSSV